MPSTGIGVYPGSLSAVENEEVSSTYEGRHLTFYETDITGKEGTYAEKGHPVVVGEHIVGVAFKTGTVANELIAIDTEGIWNLLVDASDEDGDNAVAPGDELYIDKSSAAISKNRNTVTHTLFGYALGTIAGGSEYVIAVKVHWAADDEEELVGQSDDPFVGTDASQRFREYHYEAQGGGYPHGDHLEMTVSTVACNSAQALVRKLLWTADDNWITGYAAVGEFELVVTGGAGSMDTICVLHLTSDIGVLTGTGHNNYLNSWIYIQEYSADNEMINDLLNILDTDGDYPFASGNGNVLFEVLAGDVGATHALRFVVNDVHYWILCRNAIT